MSEINVGDVSESELSERQLNIISMIKGNPFVTGKEMSETMSVTQRTIERDLSVLQKAGIIRHEGKVSVTYQHSKNSGHIIFLFVCLFVCMFTSSKSEICYPMR